MQPAGQVEDKRLSESTTSSAKSSSTENPSLPVARQVGLLLTWMQALVRPWEGIQELGLRLAAGALVEHDRAAKSASSRRRLQ